MTHQQEWRKRVLAAEEFYRWKNMIVQTLLYVSNNVGDPEHAEQIRVEVDALLGRLGVK